MLTPEQLAQIKYMNSGLKPEFVVNQLLAHIEHLTTALTAKDRVLSQFANWDNWRAVELDESRIEGGYEYVYRGGNDPVALANQALSEGKE